LREHLERRRRDGQELGVRAAMGAFARQGFRRVTLSVNLETSAPAHNASVGTPPGGAAAVRPSMFT
jgi:hypothetical protein